MSMALFFSDHAGWFTVPAVVGSLVFLFRLVLMLAGGDTDAGGGDVDLDLNADLGTDVAGDGFNVGDHPDSGHSFEVLSIQSMFTFMMGFGWGGLGGFRGAGWDLHWSFLFGIACGVGMVYLLVLLLKAVYDLESSGNISIRKAMGSMGMVYVTVPARRSGRGRVRVTLNQRQRIYNAVTDEDEAIPSKSQVRVIRVNDDQTLTVQRVNA